MKKILLNDDWLIDQYINQKRSVQSIAKDLECSATPIHRRLKQLDIVKRTPAETTLIQHSSSYTTFNPTKELLYEQYTTLQKSASVIAFENNCSIDMVYNRLNEYNIPRRTISESALLETSNDASKKYRDKEWLYEQCINRHKSTSQVAEELGVDQWTISKWTTKLDIPVVKWKGGIDTPERRRQRSRSIYYANGGTPHHVNKECSMYLGVHIAERVLFRYFEHVTRMPPCNPGFDFICSKGFKIDVKSSTLYRGNYWSFDINKSDVADYFLCIAFDDRDNLNPLHVWLIPKEKVCMKYRLCITNSEKSLAKWSMYEKPLDKVVACCTELRQSAETL